MFEASLLICSLAVPTECFRLEDTRGPYITQELCKALVDEMVHDVWDVIPNESSIKYRCIIPEAGEEANGTQT